MLDDHGFEIYEENDYPLAYLLTFRTYGTWLHGDERLSIGRNGSNIYGMPRMESNPQLEKRMLEEMKAPEVLLDEKSREIVRDAVKDNLRKKELSTSCDERAYKPRSRRAKSATKTGTNHCRSKS